MSEDYDPKSAVIDVSPYSGSVIGFSKERPVNPKTVTGKVRTIGHPVETRDIGKDLEDLAKAGDAFAEGSVEGFRLASDIFGKNSGAYRDLANSFFEAEKTLVDNTPLGRSTGAIRQRAIENLEYFYDPDMNESNTLPSFRKAKTRITDRAYKIWKNNRSDNSNPNDIRDRKRFDELAAKLRDAKHLDTETMMPGQFKDSIERSRRDGMLRAWKLISDDEKDKPGYDNNYWYMVTRTLR